MSERIKVVIADDNPDFVNTLKGYLDNENDLEIVGIAKDGKDLVIVEVKTRQTDEYGDPDIAVTRQKQRLLISAANAYIFKNSIDLDTRFDIISIIMKDGKPVIEHIKDAFLPRW